MELSSKPMRIDAVDRIPKRQNRRSAALPLELANCDGFGLVDFFPALKVHPGTILQLRSYCHDRPPSPSPPRVAGQTRGAIDNYVDCASAFVGKAP